MRHKQVLLVSLLLFLACSVAEIEPEETTSMKEKDTAGKMMTKANISPEVEEGIILHKEQSNTFMMMYDMMMQKDGAFYLPLSEEDAKSLGIPEKQYEQFLLDIERLNKETQ